jgi:two-component system sensor histidine kinase KdpD
MNSRHFKPITRWTFALGALAGIIFAYRSWFHINPTTVALTLLLYILFLAAQWGLRYAVAVSIFATAAYNYYFLPPVRTFTISDPQNWLALFAFLITGVVGSRLSQRARDEAKQARIRQQEIEILFSLSRELLQTDNVASLLNALPEIINVSAGAESVVLYLLDGDRLYEAGLRHHHQVQIPHFRQLSLTLSAPEVSEEGEVHVPLRAGARPRGMLLIRGIYLSTESFQAIGGLVSIAIDRAQALEDVAKNEASKSIERLRTLMLDSITHELRTPLTSIKGSVSTLLTSRQVSDEDRTELLTIIDEESDRVNRLISQAVEMAQLESQEVHMSFEAVTLEDLIEDAQRNCAAVFTSHPVSVSINHVARVSADPEMVGKVLCNLLENAAKYSTPGSPIFISAENTDGFVLTSVADRGIGIDPMEQGLIFDRLYRSRSQSGSTPGTGMGLPISRAIVEAHGGQLTVTSQPGHGAVFTFSLPMFAEISESR